MNSLPPSPNSLELRSARFWKFFILGLMAINLLVALIAIVIAIRDPSFKPVPSYGENGVDWQTRKRMQANSDALGWTARVERSDRENQIRVSITDQAGAPVMGLSGHLQAYHFTRAGESATVPLLESKTESGNYIADINVSKDGWWHLTLKLTRGEAEQFFWDHDVEWYR
jgi:hypothetical protein